MRMLLRIALVALTYTHLIAQSEQSWLERPLANWNGSIKGVARPSIANESTQAVAARCKLEVSRGSIGERTLADAGWLPYLHVDRKLVEGDVEIIAGLSGADGMCRPLGFNLFVFVGGQLAGTLSPIPMSSREDGSAGSVRLAPDGTIAAEFARYTEKDALCCPSGRVGVRYRIDRGARPLVVPVSTQAIR